MSTIQDASRARRIRIGDWLVDYDDATQDVELERTMKDVLTAIPGDDANCMNSRCIRAHRRERVFPHAVYLVSTIKSRVYVVDQINDAGEPVHAVRYQLSERDSRLIGEHDKYGAGEPGVLKLRVPRDPKGSTHCSSGYQGANGNGNYTGKRNRPVTSVGAKARFKVAVGALSAD